MQADQYQAEANATNSNKFHIDIDQDIIHAAIGIATEAGEFLDPIKKSMFYGKPVDLVNMDEEVGDILWYIAIYLNARGLTFERIFAQNNAKLKKRYPDKFNEHQALNRDLLGERKVLEGE